MKQPNEHKKIGNRVVNIYYVNPTAEQKDAQVKAIFECIKDKLNEKGES